MNIPSTAAASLPRPPLLPWSSSTWLRWSSQGRLSTTPIPRSPFLLLKAPVSTLYEEKFGGDRNMFTVSMYCSRMNAVSIRIGLVVDCTALDMEEFAPLVPNGGVGGSTTSAIAAGAAAATTTSSSKKQGVMIDKRVRYFHNPSEWDDFDADYQRLMPPPIKPPPQTSHNDDGSEKACMTTELPLAPQSLPEFYRIVSDYLHKIRSGDENIISSASTSTTMTYIALFDSRGGLGAASYLAACYMCHKLKASVHVALEAVKVGSPSQLLYEDGGNSSSSNSSSSSTKKFGLCDVKLIQDLQQRFKGQKQIVMEGASYPTWWWCDADSMVHADTDEDGDDGSGVDDANGGERRKRKRNEATITIPPYSSTEVCQSITSSRLRGQNDASSSTSSMLYPILPPDVLEPIPPDSPKYHRALSVLAQLTPSPPLCDPMSHLPLKGEFDMSVDSATNNGTADSLLECIKTNMDDYRVTWLATRGRRGLLLILSEAIYFMEELVEEGVSSASTTSSSSTSTSHQNIFISRVTNIKFPSSKDLAVNQHRTLLDVVLVKDVEKQPNNTNTITYRFYVLDVLCIEGGRVWHKPLELRCRYLNDGVLLPRKKDEASSYQQQQHQALPLSAALSHAHNYSKEPIKIRANEYFPMKKIEYVMKEVCRGVGHEANGVRIVPVGEYFKEVVSEHNVACTWRSGKNEAYVHFYSKLSQKALQLVP